MSDSLSSHVVAAPCADDARGARVIRLAFWAAALGLAGLNCRIARNMTTLDGWAYLDMAHGAASGESRALVNALWSPGYPALLALPLRLLHPSGLRLFALAHLVNFLIFAAAGVAFELYWRELGRLGARAGSFPPWAWQVFGYSLFLWSALSVVGVAMIEPDLLMVVLLLLASALLLRARRTRRSADLATLGAVLGLGYLAKAPMFPMALLMMVLAAAGAGHKTRQVAARATVGVAAFVLIAVPWMALLHARYHHWTVSDSGTLNYAWHVNGVRKWFYWEGDGPEHGKPLHPPRQISDHPAAFEYATPVDGTFPLIDDPAYWYEGVRLHFDSREQVHAVLVDLRDSLPRSQLPLVIGFLLVLALAAQSRSLAPLFSAAWPAWVVGAAGVAMFELVHVEPRYLGGFLLLFWSGLFAGTQLEASAHHRRLLVAIALLMGLGLNVLVLITTLRTRGFAREFNLRRAQAERVAPALRNASIRAGDPLVLLGWERGESFWVPLAEVRVVGDIPDAGVAEFWTLPESRRSELLKQFAASGAKAVLAGPIALKLAHGASPPVGWEALDRTGYAIYRLRP